MRGVPDWPSGAGGPLEATCRRDRRDGPEARVFIRDAGAGGSSRRVAARPRTFLRSGSDLALSPVGPGPCPTLAVDGGPVGTDRFDRASKDSLEPSSRALNRTFVHSGLSDHIGNITYIAF